MILAPFLWRTAEGRIVSSRSLPATSLLLIFTCAACSTDEGDAVNTVGLGDAGASADDDGSGDDGSDDDAADDDEMPEPGDDDGVDFGPGPTPVAVEEPVPAQVPAPDPVAEPSDDSPSEMNPLQACASAVATGSDPRIDDFEVLDDLILEVDGRSAGWYGYNDETATGMQLLEWIDTDDPAVSGTGVLHAGVTGFPEFSGIGLGLRWTETGSEFCYYDASYYDGVSFWAKGSGGVRVALQNPSVRPVAQGGTCPADAACWDSHGMDFTLSEGWTHYRVAFAGLSQADWGTPVGAFVPSELFTIEFQFTPGGTVDMQLDDLAFFVESEPEPEPMEPEPVEPEPIEPEPLPEDGGAPGPKPTDGGVGDDAEAGSGSLPDAATVTDAAP